jgi:hypothetical protein
MVDWCAGLTLVDKEGGANAEAGWASSKANARDLMAGMVCCFETNNKEILRSTTAVWSGITIAAE